jgi:hypothetical protein
MASDDKVRWWIRILGGLFSLVAIPMGLLAIIDGLKTTPFAFDSSFKFGIASLIFGILFLVAAVRGRLRL